MVRSRRTQTWPRPPVRPGHGARLRQSGCDKEEKVRNDDGGNAGMAKRELPHLGGEYCTTFCSMAPKTDRPVASGISMRRRSPNLRKGVEGSPFAIASSMRFSTRHAEPARLSLFDTVPEPMMVPAESGRVRAACAIRR